MEMDFGERPLATQERFEDLILFSKFNTLVLGLYYNSIKILFSVRFQVHSDELFTRASSGSLGQTRHSAGSPVRSEKYCTRTRPGPLG